MRAGKNPFVEATPTPAQPERPSPKSRLILGPYLVGTERTEQAIRAGT